MYNKDIKERFIASEETTPERAKKIAEFFNTIGAYEEKVGADICSISGEALREAITQIGGVTRQSQKNLMTGLRSYIKWCLNNGIPGACDALLKFDITEIGLDKIHRQLYANPIHLQKTLDAVFDPESKNTSDNAYRAYFWLAYAGVPQEDVFRVTVKDVDLRKMTVELNGERFQFEQQGKAAIKNCVELDSFIIQHTNYTKDWKRYDSDQLLRGVKGEITYNAMKNFVRRAIFNPDKTPKINTELGYEHVKLSGKFYRMRMMEVQGIEIDFYDIARAEMAGKEYKLDKSTVTMKTLCTQKAKLIEADYKRWKAAYPV